MAGSRSGACADRDCGADRVCGADSDEREQLPCALCIGVLRKCPLPRMATKLLGGTWIAEEVSVGAYGLLRVARDEELTTRLEPALDAFVGVRAGDGGRSRRQTGSHATGG